MECHNIAAGLRFEWIPPAIWQLGALHAFFHDPEIQNGILDCCGQGWEPIQYEEPLHAVFSSAHSMEEIVSCFDDCSFTLPHVSDLFFKLNKYIASLYSRAENSDIEMLQILVSELPPFSQWEERKFPFWKSPWIYSSSSIRVFYEAVKDLNLLSEIVKIENLAHKEGEWVLYRGYSGIGYPSTIQFDHKHSHALSFGSTLLGGAFFSLESTAITYAKPETPIPYTFLALRVQPQQMQNLFRVGPLHPFIQLLVDGEMFHAHTKIATKDTDEYESYHGYFMRCNKHNSDSIDYMTTHSMTPEELETAFHALCKTASYVFLFDPTNQ